ncbi:MAG: hypothetical protein ACI865_000375 [Flavobacteriaceae bacterium]|jgi:hypothetical protein
MKKILLTLAVFAAGYSAQSQVICAGISPVAIAGNYDFTWADPAGGDWSTPDFLIPGIFVQDTLMMVDDGTPGTNPQGNPIAQEACFPLINSVAGKIAVLYRNTCEFGAKALNAQDSGAVGVIIINRDPESVGMGGGASGGLITIPVVMLSSTDGATLVAEMALGPVEVFLGNKTGLYQNDAGLTKGTTLISKASGVPSQLAQDGSEFNFDLGTRVYNYGQLDQANMLLRATVDGPSGNIYDETITLPTVLSGDSMDVDPSQVLNFPQFSSATYPDGLYTVMYNVALDSADAYDADNWVTANFMVSDSIYSLADVDTLTGIPTQNNGFRPSTNTATFSACIVLDNPNASRLGVEGLYFAALGSAVDLTGEEIALYAYRWEDVFADLNDPALAFDNLNPVGLGFYYYPSDLQGEMVYGALNEPIALEDNQRYLFCAQTVNLEVFLGFDNTLNYLWNEAHYAQPLGPVENDGAYFAAGFGMEQVSSIGVKVGDVGSFNIGLDENGTIEGMAYPNPAKDVVTISINTNENGTVRVSDLSGKVVLTDALSFANGNSVVNIADLDAGVYLFNVTLENGQSSQFSVVKN